MFIENKYYSAYLRIVESAASRGTGDEWHHIIPKSLGGTDARENLVHLTEREHFICHSLLVRCTAGLVKRKMHFAYWRMVNGARTYTPNARSYEWARKTSPLRCRITCPEGSSTGLKRCEARDHTSTKPVPKTTTGKAYTSRHGAGSIL